MYIRGKFGRDNIISRTIQISGNVIHFTERFTNILHNFINMRIFCLISFICIPDCFIIGIRCLNQITQMPSCSHQIMIYIYFIGLLHIAFSGRRKHSVLLHFPHYGRNFGIYVIGSFYGMFTHLLICIGFGLVKHINRYLIVSFFLNTVEGYLLDFRIPEHSVFICISVTRGHIEFRRTRLLGSITVCNKQYVICFCIAYSLIDCIFILQKINHIIV